MESNNFRPSGDDKYMWRMSPNHGWIEIPKSVGLLIKGRMARNSPIPHEQLAEWLWDAGHPKTAQMVVDLILESRRLQSTP